MLGKLLRDNFFLVLSESGWYFFRFNHCIPKILAARVFNSTCKKALGTALQLEGKGTLTNTSKLARANATGKKTTLVIFMCNNDIH